MTEAPSAPGATLRGRGRPAGELPCYGALDLGTNNCRLLIATPQGAGGFRVVEAYSRIVRLGEGLSQSGRLSEAAMERAMAALKVSAEKVRRRRVMRLRAIATQACRMAVNGPAFIERVAQSRHTTPEQIDAIGRGRVWTGAQAREQGLVDALGGLDVAVTLAKQRAGVPADEEVELVTYSPQRSFYEAITESFRGSATRDLWGMLTVGGAEGRTLASLTAPGRLFRRGEPLALMPFAFSR